MLASFGSLPAMFWPVADDTPLPASGYHCQSLPVCGPYLATEKLASLERFAPSFASQPRVGMVIIASAPAFFVLPMNASASAPAVALLYGMDSKYQSKARLSAFCCQL